MNDFTGRIKRDEWRPPAGFRRTLTCALDTAQYQLDMDALAARRATEDVYAGFNLLMRRKPKVQGALTLLASGILWIFEVPLQSQAGTLAYKTWRCSSV